MCVLRRVECICYYASFTVKPLDHYLDIENENEDDVAVLEDTEEPATSAKALKPILVAKKQPQKSQKAAASRVDKSPEFRPQASSRIDNVSRQFWFLP